jgi:hypothetical protein
MPLGDYTVKMMVFNEGDMEHLQTLGGIKHSG